MPVFTIKVDCMKINYLSYVDHDNLSGHIGNFRIFDNTNYPKTLDPSKQYSTQDKTYNNLIIGFKTGHKS